MTRIRATCPACGEVDLRPDDIELTVVRSTAGEVGDGSRYTFACPDCTDQVEKPADERIARLLATGGVPVTVDQVGRPAAAHPEGVVDGPPLGLDDVLAFHELLERDDWFAELEASLR